MRRKTMILKSAFILISGLFLSATLPGLCSGIDISGQVKLTGNLTQYEDGTIQREVFDDPWMDASALLRLKAKVVLSDLASVNLHYLASGITGDTWRSISQINSLLTGSGRETRFQYTGCGDPTALMDLSSVISQGEDYRFCHSLDRLAVEFSPSWGTLILGRQAATWGNGMIFNPMDLFNPFAPSDIDRDYKKGDDMAYFRTRAGDTGEIQVLYVPRRDATTGDVTWNNSSLGAKLHLFSETTEFDIMGACHRQDLVVGAGSTGYLGNAAWRIDAVYTVSGGNKDDNFLSLVANLDTSWTWLGKNVYGLLEYYYCGLGSDDYSRVFTDPDIYERLEAGDIHTLGKHYLSGSLTLELHPLLNAVITLINNLQDPSGLIQPRLVWSAASSLEITAGASLCYGGMDTEFGSIQIPDTDYTIHPGNAVFLWVTRFF